jgi:chromosome segregation ATPase
MRAQQPEALRLADLIERYNSGVHSQAIVEDYSKAAAELRRLHAANLDCMEWFKAVKSERDELLEAMLKLTAACKKVSEVMAEACDWPDTSGELEALHTAVSEMRFAMPDTPSGD